MGVLCRFAYDMGLFSVIFLLFLQKYCCVLIIGFSADVSIDIFIDMFIGMCIDMFTDKEEGKRISS